MDSEAIRAIRENRWDVSNTDACLWRIAELIREKLTASQALIALWRGVGESPSNWRAWTATRVVATGREISSLGGSLTLLNAARALNQLQTEAVNVADISKTASINAHRIRYGMAFPLRRSDLLTRSIQFSGVFYVDRRDDAHGFSPSEQALAESLSDAIESTVALVHANQLVASGLPTDEAKRQIRPLIEQKVAQHKGVLTDLAKDRDIIEMLSSQESAPTPSAVQRLISELGLEPMRVALKASLSAREKLEELEAAIRTYGDMKKAAQAMGIDHGTFRQQHSRAKREVEQLSDD